MIRVGASQDVLAIPTHGALKFVINALVVVDITQAGHEVLVHGDGGDGLGFLSQIPQLYVDVVAGENIIIAFHELNVTDRRNNITIV